MSKTFDNYYEISGYMNAIGCQTEDFHTYDKQWHQISTQSCSSGQQSTQWSPNSYTNDWPDFVLTKKDIFAFKRLIEEPVVRDMLLWDECCLLADKYLLAMALTYFKRAGLRHQQFTPVYLM